MASALSFLNKRVRHTDLGATVGGFFLNTGIEAGSGFGINYLRCRHRDKTWGQRMPWIAAIAGKAAALGVGLIGMKARTARGATAAHLVSGAFDSLGGSGVTLIGAEYGARYGNKAAGVQAFVMPAGQLPANARQISMGALPPAPEGEAMTWPQLMQLSEMA